MSGVTYHLFVPHFGQEQQAIDLPFPTEWREGMYWKMQYWSLYANGVDEILKGVLQSEDGDDEDDFVVVDLQVNEPQ